MRPTYEQISRFLRYDPESGHLYWKKPRRGARGRLIAGCVHKHLGYVLVTVNRYRTYAHRVAWLLMTKEWPPSEVDHVNGNRADNRWVNLRSATSSQNKMNKKVRSDSRTGLKGAWLHSPGKWRSKVKVNGVIHDLGLFDSPQEAHEAYIRKSRELHGDFAFHGGDRC